MMKFKKTALRDAVRKSGVPISHETVRVVLAWPAPEEGD